MAKQKRLTFILTAILLFIILSKSTVLISNGRGAVFADADNRSKNAGKTIYITFDDGPSAYITPRVLDILIESGIKASFFVVGEQAERHTDIIKRMHREGHTVALHCYRHDYSSLYSSVKGFKQDIFRAARVLQTILPGYDCRYLRFPGGSFGLDKQFVYAARDMGYRYVDWNSTNGDTLKEVAAAKDAYDYAVSTAAGRKKVIMLMHDNKSLTLHSLKRIIDHFKQEGYSFCAL